MASELRVNTLKDASGNNSIGMSYVAEGSAKAWANFDGSGGDGSTISARDSFNFSSVADNGTGDYTLSFSNGMNNANYVGNTGAAANASAATFSNPYTGASFTSSAPTTSAFRYANFAHNSASYKDVDYTSASILGDLA